MFYQDIFGAVVVIVIGAALLAWLVFHAGQISGYRAGVQAGSSRGVKTQHLRGMVDGYVMALQHTPAQRDEYLRNVLLKTGAVTQTDIDVDRQRRRERQNMLAQKPEAD